MCSVDEVSAAIEDGSILWSAGDSRLLAKLPNGRWIGGSIPYFMAEDGGQTTRDRIYCSEMIAELATAVEVKSYDTDSIHRIAKEAPDNGFTILLIPAFTDLHVKYAQYAPGYEEMFKKPIVGWVTGVHLDDLGRVRPSVFNGVTGEHHNEKAVAMHVSLRPDKKATVNIVNTFGQGEGDEIQFQEIGFTASRCLINGKERNFAEYTAEKRLDTRLPLVAEYSGTMVNVSFQKVDSATGTVSFYAPVFSDVRYRLAAPVTDFVQAFRAALPRLKDPVIFSCNCVLNYLHSELAGKTTGDMTGPMTFGEIAYRLLNQTLVYLAIEET
ncbi:MAG: hypothetical protein HYY48_09095 [Gammaproteobacteria bacterium]|nr:hypothetical protein [Gammaproteobacteria bacterium]